MTRKSLWGPSLFTLFGLALLLGLGTWQVQRLHWKEGLIAERAAGLAAPPAALPRALAAAQALEYHSVRAAGHFTTGHDLLLHALSESGEPGYHHIAPFILTGGGTVLVDRGLADAAPPGDGVDQVAGLLRLAPGRPSWFTPDNRPDRNEWFYVDPAAMAQAAHVTGILPFYIDASGQPPPDLPNNHLQYAITWYALAAALVIIYILLLRRRMGERM
jgi:surfeit locus 1 family protein